MITFQHVKIQELCTDATVIVQGNVEQAKNELKAAIRATAASRTTIAGEVAMANILVQQKRFAEAHRFYCQVGPVQASSESILIIWIK
jgi:predicted negative regulator of RcsB-dependent stress response